MRRAEPRAGPVGDARVERHPDDGDVHAVDLVDAGQLGERRRAGEARDPGVVDLAHVVAVDDAGERVRHRAALGELLDRFGVRLAVADDLAVASRRSGPRRPAGISPPRPAPSRGPSGPKT